VKSAWIVDRVNHADFFHLFPLKSSLHHLEINGNGKSTIYTLWLFNIAMENGP
jgi:hypothetical protein